MRLLLSGEGNPEKVVNLDIFFSKSIDRTRPILYIPDDDCLEWFKNTYGKYEITNIDICIDLNKYEDLSKYSAIFIGETIFLNY